MLLPSRFSSGQVKENHFTASQNQSARFNSGHTGFLARQYWVLEWWTWKTALSSCQKNGLLLVFQDIQWIFARDNQKLFLFRLFHCVMSGPMSHHVSYLVQYWYNIHDNSKQAENGQSRCHI